MCVGCFGLVVSTCQVIGKKSERPSEDTLTVNAVRRLHPQSRGGRECLCVFFLLFGLSMLLCVPLALHIIHNIYFIRL